MNEVRRDRAGVNIRQEADESAQGIFSGPVTPVVEKLSKRRSASENGHDLFMNLIAEHCKFSGSCAARNRHPPAISAVGAILRKKSRRRG
jgi:hypothetical protein